MPRIRTIKPEIASNAKLARVSREARLTFILAITQADDWGLLLGNARQLMGALYPHDADVTPPKLDGWIAELAAAGFVRWRERADGQRVLELPTWHEHQKVSHPHRPVLRDKLLPVSETPPVVPTPAEPPADDGAVAVPLDPPGFAACWTAYPKRNGANPRIKAASAYRARLREQVTPDVMLAGTERYAAWCRATGKAGTETVMQAVRFFGTERAFLVPWQTAGQADADEWDALVGAEVTHG